MNNSDTDTDSMSDEFPERDPQAGTEDASPGDILSAETVRGAEVSDAADQGDSAPQDDDPERLYTKDDVDKLLAQAADSRLRIQAEYDNFRRRTAREKKQWIVDALEGFVKDLLPVLDSFDKAREVELSDGEAAAMREGLDVINKQLRGVLDQYGIAVIDPVGEPFDPAFHEALMRQSSPDHAPGTVITVFERGYSIGGRLIRAARVVVAAE
jgi:molecular chaperone GrpE